MNNYQKGGSRGARFGLMIENVFATRSGGKISKLQKTDVVDQDLIGHSIKNTRSSPNSRIEARSYSTIDTLPFAFYFQDFIQVRQNNLKHQEKIVCERLANILNQNNNTLQLFTKIFTNYEPGLKKFTVYDNRTETSPENLTGRFRCFEMHKVIQFLSENITWKVVKGRAHYNINGYLNDFRPISVSIGLGSPSRKLLLFTLNNIQKQLDFWEAVGFRPKDIM